MREQDNGSGKSKKRIMQGPISQHHTLHTAIARATPSRVLLLIQGIHPHNADTCCSCSLLQWQLAFGDKTMQAIWSTTIDYGGCIGDWSASNVHCGFSGYFYSPANPQRTAESRHVIGPMNQPCWILADVQVRFDGDHARGLQHSKVPETRGRK
jgi:hypothetical protein